MTCKRGKNYCKHEMLIELYNILVNMKVSYGLVFFFAVAMAMATVALLFLYLKPIRHLVMGIVKKFRIGEGSVYNFGFWIIFFLIMAILVDAIWSYLALKAALDISSKDMLLDNFDMIKAHQHDDYIILYKKFREYYMAERNFMLTASALFIMFAFNRFFTGLKRLYEMEISNSTAR